MPGPQYSTDGSSWVDLKNSTRDMLAGSFDGRFELIYPQASTYTLSGIPCGAYGLPRAELKSTLMPTAAMNAWFALFEYPTTLSIPIYMDVWSPYHGTLMTVYGRLEFPKWERTVGYGYTGKLYANVEIIVSNITMVDIIR